MKVKVQECTFKFECNKHWEALKEISGEASVRYCSECDRGVHLCTTPEEFQHHANLGHCVAFAEDGYGRIDSFNKVVSLRVGEPSIGYAKHDANPQLDLDIDPSGSD